jgi:hypothetical protein
MENDIYFDGHQGSTMQMIIVRVIKQIKIKIRERGMVP